MAVQLGARAEHGFDQPLGLLSDCHRRIERFLAILQKVLVDANGRQLNDDQRRAVETSLTYFHTAAPRHTEDEECSLFPLLRESQLPQARQAMQKLEALEQDHSAAEADHAEVHALYRRWLGSRTLPPPETQRLEQVLTRLRELYARHIEVEDRDIFPLAAQVLNGEQLARVGREMADRRGVDPAAR